MHVLATGTTPSTRRLQQDTAVGLRVADFSYLPENLNMVNVFHIPESQLTGAVEISSSGGSGAVALFGTYFLGPPEAQQIAQIITDEMVCPLFPVLAGPAQPRLNSATCVSTDVSGWRYVRMKI